MKKKFWYLFLVSFLGILTALPISADYVDQEAAPLSPKFIEWQRLHNDNLQSAYRVFSDLGQSEFSTGYRPSPIDTSHLSNNLPDIYKNSFGRARASEIPSKYDLRTYNRLTEIKNQNPYGACWTFGASAAMESNYLTQNLSFLNSRPDLSELHMAWFAYKDPTPGNNFVSLQLSEYGADPVLDQGGNYTMSTAYLARMTGPVNESSLEYSKASNMSSMSQNPKDYFPLALRLKETHILGSLSPKMSASERRKLINLMKENIMTHGAMSVNYYAGEGATSPNNSVSAYFDNSHDDNIDHEVTIVGWDDDFDRTKFNSDSTKLPNNNGAWIVRNSWGNNWGNNGYFYMSYEQYLGSSTIYVVKENPEGIKHYGHDALGFTNDFSRVWAANVFRTENWNEGLKEIGFYTTAHNTSFDLYIYNLGTDTPVKPVPENINSPLYTKKDIEIDYAGYHTLELDDLIPLSRDHYFSVIIRMHSNFAYPTAVETAVQEFAEPVINSGESWFAKGDSEILTTDMIWDDGKNGITFANNSIPTPMNACIKAFTVPLTSGGIAINKANFPDSNFISYIKDNFETDKNDYLSDSEISAAKSVSVSEKNISDLKGIEFLVELESLDCSKNLITALDLRYNSELQVLDCSENKLKVLDLSNNTKITAGNLKTENQNIDDTAQISETFNDDEYAYKFELSDLFSSDIFVKILDVQGISSYNTNIDTMFKAEENVAEFKEKPSKIAYYYDTGVNNSSMSVYSNVSSILKPVKPTIKTSSELPDGRISEYYAQDIIARGTGSITWTKTSGDIPEGLKFSSSGRLSGTPQYAGIYKFEAAARNEIGTTSADFKIKILNIAPTVSANKISESVTAGEGTFNIIVNAIKGTNISWIGGGLLPSGVNVSSNDNAFKIFGTPALTEAGKTFTYYVTASNDVDFARQTINLNVKNVAPVFNNIASLYEVDIQRNVRIILTASKGTNLKWTTAGNLPSGLTGKNYGTNSFKIEGTPEESSIDKEFIYTVTAENDVASESKKFTFKVSKGDSSKIIPEGQRISMEDYLDSLTDEELAGITTLVIPENVKDLSGLDEIEGLPTLDFSNNGLITEVDLDGNDTVENLIFSKNSGVKKLNIAKSRVKSVEAENSNLEELDIAGSEYIEYLNICNTNVASLNAKDCKNLKVILCSDSEINSIILDGCVSLKEFECDGNRLARLDLEEFNFTEFACFGQEVEGWKLSREMNFSDFIIASVFASDYDDEVYSSYFSKISNVQGYDSGGHRIPTTYDNATGKISFPSIPKKITYDYNTGFENEIMDVTVSGETSNNEDEESGDDSDSSGGGCGVGFSVLGLILIFGIFLMKW